MTQEIAPGITVDPAVMVGKPVLRGTRLPVELVLAKLAANPNLADLLADYPELTVDQVKACLQYATALVQAQEHTRRGKLPAQPARHRGG